MRRRSLKAKWQRYPHRPANYVLWQDGLDYYVSKRVGVLRDSALREHFIAFFRDEADAWRDAERRTWDLIDRLEHYIKRFRRNRRGK
jgi:hypothetical protein